MEAVDKIPSVTQSCVKDRCNRLCYHNEHVPKDMLTGLYT